MIRDQPDHVDATVYVVIEPKWSPRARDVRGRPVLEGAKVDRVVQSYPQTIRRGAIVSRLTLRHDANALLPLQPQAIVHIGTTDVEVIEVTADQPHPPDPLEGQQP